MLRSRLLFLGALAAWLGLGCGGSGGSSGGGDGLSGTLNVDTFLIPAGTTKTVTADLTINAKTSLEIDGTLLVPAGVNVWLISGGSVTIPGHISPAATAKATPKFRGDGDFDVSMSGSNITISGDVVAPGGTGILMAGNGGGDITITSAKTPDGANSNTRGNPGDSARNIEIGTATAIDKVKGHGAPNATVPNTIKVGTLTTGKGGAGFPDFSGVDNGTTVSAIGTGGGSGGNIILVAKSSVHLIDVITAGDGGDGGRCFIAVAAQTVAHKKGKNISETSGDGGNGGSVSIAPSLTSNSIFAGLRGHAGNLTATGAKGGPNGGDGGEVTAAVGQSGSDGTGGTVDDDHNTLLYSLQAGDGADATDAAINGGNGGSITLTDKKGGAAPAPALTPKIVPGVGGAGFSGCGLSKIAGSNGGKVGNLNLKGLAYTVGNWVGGKGGDGSGPGTGGAAGLDDQGKPVGTKGADGVACAGSTATLSRTISTSTSNPSFASLDTATQKIGVTSADLGKTEFAVVDLATGMSNTFTTTSGISDVNGSIANSSTTTRGTNVFYIAANVGKAVLIVNEANGSQLGSITMPTGATGPNGIAFDPASGRLYVSVQNKSLKGEVEVYDTHNSNNLIGSIATDTVAYSMVLNPGANRLYVGNYSTMQLSVLDTSALTQIRTVLLPDNSGVVSLNPKTNTVYATLYNSSSVIVMSKDLDQTITTIKVGPSPWGIGVDSTRNRVFIANYNYSSNGPQVGTVSEIDGATNKVLATITVGKSPTGVTVDEAADKIYVADGGDNTIDVLNGN